MTGFISEEAAMQLALALITLVGVLGTAFLAYLGQREARGANRAVNNVGPGEAPLKDRVGELERQGADHTALLSAHGEMLGQILDAVTSPESVEPPRNAGGGSFNAPEGTS